MKVWLLISKDYNDISNLDEFIDSLKELNLIKSGNEFILSRIYWRDPLGINFSLNTCLPTKLLPDEDSVIECKLVVSFGKDDRVNKFLSKARNLNKRIISIDK